MRIGVILLLVAGPFAVRAQLISNQGLGNPASGWERSNSLFSLWRPPAVAFPKPATRDFYQAIYAETVWHPFPENLRWRPYDRKPMTLHQLDSFRFLLPDRMPCLVPLRVIDRMPRRMQFCCGVEKMPNGIKRTP